MIYDKVFISLETLKIATITNYKNTAMIIVIPVIAMKSNNLNYSKNKIGNFIQFFPLFILGFIFLFLQEVLEISSLSKMSID